MNYGILFNLICRIMLESSRTNKSISEGEIFISFNRGSKELNYFRNRHGYEQLTIRWFGTVTNKWVFSEEPSQEDVNAFLEAVEQI